MSIVNILCKNFSNLNINKCESASKIYKAYKNSKELDIRYCDTFEKVCDFELNIKTNSKTLWNIKFCMKINKLNDKNGRVYLLVVNNKIKKIGQTDDSYGIRNIGGYKCGNSGMPSIRTTGVHYYIAKQLYYNKQVSLYCTWCPELTIKYNGFNINDNKNNITGSFSAKDLEKYYLELYITKIGRKPELNLQEDCKKWNDSITNINNIIKSKKIKSLPKNINDCNIYWKLYHWKYNNYKLFN